jgi:hypothetical protein
MPIINFVAYIVYSVMIVAFCFVCYVMINRALKLRAFWLAMILWLIPPYPLAYVIAHSFPSNGYSAGLGDAITGFLWGLAWFVIYPVVGAIVLDIKLKKKLSSPESKQNYQHNYLFYGIGIFVVLCFLVWFVAFR